MKKKHSKNLSVLIVDDDAQLRRFVGSMFEREGWLVCDAPEASYALSLVTSTDRLFNVILVDIALPGMNGIDFIKALQDSSVEHGSLIGVITGVASTQQEQTLRALNPKFIYRKPFNPLDLIQEVERYFA